MCAPPGAQGRGDGCATWECARALMGRVGASTHRTDCSPKVPAVTLSLRTCHLRDAAKPRSPSPPLPGMEVWELKLSAIHHLVVKTLKCSHFPATRLLHSMFFLTTSLYLFSCQGRQPKETSHRCPGLVRVKTTALSA